MWDWCCFGPIVPDAAQCRRRHGAILQHNRLAHGVHDVLCKRLLFGIECGGRHNCATMCRRHLEWRRCDGLIGDAAVRCIFELCTADGCGHHVYERLNARLDVFVLVTRLFLCVGSGSGKHCFAVMLQRRVE